MTQIDRINGLVGSIAVKVPCKAATTANITLSGAQTIDGISLTSGDRCLVKNQTTASQNGIYDVSSTAWSRAIDFNGTRDITQGTAVRIVSGTVSAQYFYEVTTADALIGTTDIDFALVNFPVTTTPFMATLLDDETAAEARTTLGVDFKGALISASGAQVISDSTLTNITFNVEEYDTSSIYDSGNTDRLTVPPGATKVRLTGGVNFASNATGERTVAIRKNTGSGDNAFVGSLENTKDGDIADSIYTQNVTSAIVSVVAGNYFVLRVSQDSGGNLNTTSSSYFAMEIIE